MDFVSSRELRVNPGPIFERLQSDGEVVVTSRGKPIALLVGLHGDDLEETLRAVRRARAETIVAQMRRAAQDRGYGALSSAEIEDEIRAARRERRSR